MYDITLLSIFRDSAAYLDRYIDQVEEALDPFEKPHLIWLEGDSMDDTFEKLTALSEQTVADVTLIQFDTNGPYWPSIDHPMRWQQLEACWNKALSYLEPSAICVCVESDLIWRWPTLRTLIGDVQAGLCEVACPMLMRHAPQMGDYFYDTNAFCKDGQHFTNLWPYHPALLNEERFVPLETGGGMLVTNSDSLSQARWQDKCVLRFGSEARVLLDTRLKIYHP